MNSRMLDQKIPIGGRMARKGVMGLISRSCTLTAERRRKPEQLLFYFALVQWF